MGNPDGFVYPCFMFTRPGSMLILALLLAVPGCKAKVGGTCADEGEARCDGARMLVCQSNRWVEVACAGPGGCKRSGRYVDCDESRARVGDPCGNEPRAYSSCSVDGKVRLRCERGVWRADLPCRGPGGCVHSGRFVDCDDSVAELGDACEPGAYSCSVDRTSMLLCRGGKYTEAERCAPGRCEVSGSTIECAGK